MPWLQLIFLNVMMHHFAREAREALTLALSLPNGNP
jgi:hypothetical protein